MRVYSIAWLPSHARSPSVSPEIESKETMSSLSLIFATTPFDGIDMSQDRMGDAIHTCVHQFDEEFARSILLPTMPMTANALDHLRLADRSTLSALVFTSGLSNLSGWST